MTSEWRQIDVEWRRIDVDTTSFWRHVPAGCILLCLKMKHSVDEMSLCMKKQTILVSDQVRH